jgi:hypothetical protein
VSAGFTAQTRRSLRQFAIALELFGRSQGVIKPAPKPERSFECWHGLEAIDVGNVRPRNLVFYRRRWVCGRGCRQLGVNLRGWIYGQGLMSFPGNS